jgi:hypothetical protein
MAIKIKVKTIQIPNIALNNVEEKEAEIEEEIKQKMNNGYSMVGCAGGDCYVILIFKKED